MDITSLGHASFKIRGKQATVVTDPYTSDMVGLKFPRLVTADIVTVSHDHEDHNAVDDVGETPFIVHAPGEYEVKGVSILGVATFHDEEKGAKRGRNTMYRIEVDGVSIVHAGDLGHTLSPEEVEKLNGVDILLIPVGGVYTIDAVQATKIVRDIEPAIVIPMHYLRDGMNKKEFGELSPVSAFLTHIGKEDVTPQDKLTISKDKLPEEMQVVVLS
jgi:L-ascorbate metabolism protein UlaG (beta-lactamase superfamily)